MSLLEVLIGATLQDEPPHSMQLPHRQFFD